MAFINISIILYLNIFENINQNYQLKKALKARKSFVNFNFNLLPKQEKFRKTYLYIKVGKCPNDKGTVQKPERERERFVARVDYLFIVLIRKNVKLLDYITPQI